LGGVVGMILGIAMLWLAPILWGGYRHSVAWGALSRFVFWWFVARFFVLTWIGGCHVASPFSEIGQVFSVIYFALFLVLITLVMI
jgi:quinol-cytochrome oxidoreductase complex cytochrome b subunit